MSQSGSNSGNSRFMPETAIAILIFVFLIWFSATAGLARFAAAIGFATGHIEPLNRALVLSPADPEVHYNRGAVLVHTGNYAAGISEFEEAARLRPDDYFLWVELARARDLNGDAAGAVKASRQAVLLAPHYAPPHWQLGNLLIRTGRADDGFAELRRASFADPARFPALIDLAWHAFGGDANLVREHVQPESTGDYLALARHFKKTGQTEEATAFLRAVQPDASAMERQRWVQELISERRFHDAHRVWSIAAPSKDSIAGIVNGSFEDALPHDNQGFGWELNKPTSGLQINVDHEVHQKGLSSLRLDFSGLAQTKSALLSQLVLVEKKTKYVLRFAARTREIVTGRLPEVSIQDASSDGMPVLGASAAIPPATNGWQVFTMNFDTGEATTAIKIRVGRRTCSSEGPCPIFGHLWLDNFTLEKI